MSWLRLIEPRGLSRVVAGVIALSVGAWLAPTAHAQDMPAKDMSAKDMTTCAAFKWPLDKERAAFEAAGLEKVSSGAARGAWKEQAFELALVPVADVAYALPPKKKKDAGPAQSGGMLAFAAPEKPGVYQVTLSGEGWIDLVQDAGSLKSAGHSGAKDCPGLRKSVRFNVGAAPVVLQVSGAPAGSIKIAIRPAE
jgi:hypothetical protein